MLTLVKTEKVGPPEFAEFWTAYPKKEGKKYAEKCWNRLPAKDQALAMEALPNHIKKWSREGRDRQFIPDCSSWLNQARYEDEIDLTPLVGNRPAAQAPAKLVEAGERSVMPDKVRDALAKMRGR